MSDEREGEGAPERLRSPEDIGAALRLRPGRRRVTRLSRKVLAAGAAVALVIVGGATIWALQYNGRRGASPEELYSTDHHNTADGLAALPRDYAGIPRSAPPLGPPLPGDLGRPMLNAGAAPNTVVPAVDQEAQRRAQETEAARLSRLFAETSLRDIAAPLPLRIGRSLKCAAVFSFRQQLAARVGIGVCVPPQPNAACRSVGALFSPARARQEVQIALAE